jgi:hypothetical protein
MAADCGDGRLSGGGKKGGGPLQARVSSEAISRAAPTGNRDAVNNEVDGQRSLLAELQGFISGRLAFPIGDCLPAY